MTTTSDVVAARFVVSTGRLCAEDENLVTLFLQTEGQAVDWWHYLHGTWLVLDDKGRTVEDWFERLSVLVPTAYLLVLEVDAATPTWFKGHPRACEWLRDRWAIDAPRRDEAATRPAADEATALGGCDALTA